jgi:hypothetical protein
MKHSIKHASLRRESSDLLFEEQLICRSTRDRHGSHEIKHSKRHSRLAQGENWAYS